MFQWRYKQCPCCLRVVPDSIGVVGECELCKVRQTLLDSPPISWFQTVDVRGHAGQLVRVRSKWQHEWENRPLEELCPHELQYVELFKHRPGDVSAKRHRSRKVA